MKKLMVVLFVLASLLATNVSTVFAGQGNIDAEAHTVNYYTIGCLSYIVESNAYWNYPDDPEKQGTHFEFWTVDNINVQNTCTGVSYSYTNTDKEWTKWKVKRDGDYLYYLHKGDNIWSYIDTSDGSLHTVRYKGIYTSDGRVFQRNVWIDGVKIE